MKEKIKAIEKELKKLEDNKIDLIDLMVYDEIVCQLDEEINENNFAKIFTSSKNAYLDSYDDNLHDIVKYCINNVDRLDYIGSSIILMNC